jgi:hypothetical protein
MHSVRPIPILTRSTPSSDCFIVPKPLDILFTHPIRTKSKSQVITITLAGSASLESLEDHVGDALGGEDVAAYDGCLVRGREERFWRDENFDRLETTLVEGDVFGDQTSEAINDGAVSYSLRGVCIT